MAGGFKRIGGGSPFLVSSFKNVLMTYDIGTAPVGGRGPGEPWGTQARGIHEYFGPCGNRNGPRAPAPCVSGEHTFDASMTGWCVAMSNTFVQRE